MDNILHNLFLRSQNKDRRSQHDEVAVLHPRSHNTSSFRQPNIAFQGPLQGAGDVHGTVGPHHVSWQEWIVREMEKATPAKQLVAGGMSGWASGFMCAKVGRVAAIAVGGSIILLQIAIYQGFVQVNWTRLERRLEDTRRRINKQTLDNLPTLAENLREFARRHFLLTGSFVAGFFIGFAM